MRAEIRVATRLRSRRDDGTAGEPRPRTSARARPYLLSPTPLKALSRARREHRWRWSRSTSPGSTLGLYAALALRSLLFDPKPILWGLLWDHETDWLAFLILLLLLVFWRARLYAPRELREGAGRVVPTVFLVAALVARVRDRHRASTSRPSASTSSRAIFVAVADRALPRELRDC